MAVNPEEFDCLFVGMKWLHHPHLLKIFGVEMLCNGYGAIMPVRPKVSVRWEVPPKTKWPHPDHKMWVGKCAGCDHTTQYWSWGAAYGHMLEHRWIGCKGDRRRGADRRRKYERDETRLSCGGRTHSIMGDQGGDTVRRADLPSDVPSVSAGSTQEEGRVNSTIARCSIDGELNTYEHEVRAHGRGKEDN